MRRSTRVPLLRLTALALCAALPASARSPAPARCAERNTDNAQLTADAVNAAKALFPGAKALGPCTRFADTMQVNLAPFELKEGNVTLTVQGMAVREDSPWQARPFRDRAAVTDVVKRIRSHPLVAAVVPADQPLFCLASTDAPGKTAWYLCSTTRMGVTDSTPSSGYLRGTRVEFEFAEYGRVPEGCGCESFMLANFSIPFSRVTDATPGWCAAAGTQQAKDFVKAHVPAMLTVARSHEYTATLRAADGAQVELPVASKACFCSPPPPCESPSAPEPPKPPPGRRR